jgi:hypothetical protein
MCHVSSRQQSGTEPDILYVLSKKLLTSPSYVHAQSRLNSQVNSQTARRVTAVHARRQFADRHRQETARTTLVRLSDDFDNLCYQL